MQEKYDRKKVELSFRRFNDFVSDVLNSDHTIFDSNLEIFIDHCENDEVMSIISNQLKYENAIFNEWWSKNKYGAMLSILASKKLTLPVEEKNRVIIYYQLCLKIKNNEIDVISFCLNFTNCDRDGKIRYFNKNIVMPMARSLKYELDGIMSKSIIEQGNEGYIPKEALVIYLDYSTTVNGDVNAKGNVAIGEGASIETKKLI